MCVGRLFISSLAIPIVARICILVFLLFFFLSFFFLFTSSILVLFVSYSLNTLGTYPALIVITITMAIVISYNPLGESQPRPLHHGASPETHKNLLKQIVE